MVWCGRGGRFLDSAKQKCYPNRAKQGKLDHEEHASAAMGGPMPAEVGSKAPDFTLTNHERQPVTLSAQRGRPVVLAFFPAAFSSVCTTELCAFRDRLGELSRVNAQVYGISVDTFFALKAFRDQQQLNFPLLSDFNKTVIREYGVLNPDMIGLKGVASRAVFVIDKAGIVRHAEVLDDARREPDYSKVFAALEGLTATTTA